jgi:hypothetical protein
MGFSGDFFYSMVLARDLTCKIICFQSRHYAFNYGGEQAKEVKSALPLKYAGRNDCA